MNSIKIHVGVTFDPLSFSEKDRALIEATFKKYVSKYKVELDSNSHHEGEIVYEIFLTGTKEYIYQKLENLFLDLKEFNLYFTSSPVKEDCECIKI